MTTTSSDPAPRHRYPLRTLLSLRSPNTDPSFLKHQATLLGSIFRPEPIPIPPLLGTPFRHRYSPDRILSLRPHLPYSVSHSSFPSKLPSPSPPPSVVPSSSPPSLPRPIPRSNFKHTSDDRRFPLSMSPPSEFRRRSPSPPASSPISSSPPPGFESSFSKPLSKHAAKAAICREREAMYRSRICKGPDLTRNFASRLAYHGLRVEPSPSPSPPPSLRAQTRPVLHRSRSPSPDLSRRLHASTDSKGAPGKRREGQNGKGRAQAEVSRPPVVSYNISGVVSFEDFSKRLAAEVAGNDLLENKAGGHINNGGEDSPTVEENIPRNEGQNVEEKQEKHSPTPQEEAASELSKWFGCISAIAEEDHPEQQREADSSFIPLEEVERQMTEVNGPLTDESKEELDSNVLSFFDTIRSQAMGELTEIMPENGDVHGPLYNESFSSGMENYFHSKYVAGETANVRENEKAAEQLNTNDGEQYLHMLSIEKPVYKTADLKAENRNGVPSDGAYKGQPSASAPSPGQVQQGSESVQLERWFNSLVLQSELES